jgi:lipopolysaccharide/colanic/teichoic acid biosynthesis glycosyltransferase/FlaA1/EpsC-like NDP-sugar epimerase
MLHATPQTIVKRATDIILSIAGLLVTLPFFPLVTMLIKLDSKGPIFYPVERVGKHMKNFKMYKFRTMLDQAANFGASVSPEHDPRVTTFGRFLRRTKLNEFPQLINILKGEMTFVGPRPESPDLAALYPNEAQLIFSVTPGLVGPNQIINRNEEELYPPGVDPKRYYIDHILPAKLQVDLEYIRDAHLFKDIYFIFRGVKETVLGVLNKKQMGYNKSQTYLLVGDAILVLVSYLSAFLVVNGPIPNILSDISFYWFIGALLVLRLGFFAYFGMYHTVIRFISYHDVLAAVKGVLASGIVAAFGINTLDWNLYLPILTAVDCVILIVLIAILRFSLRFYWEKKNKSVSKSDRHRMLIYGAGNQARNAYRALSNGLSSFFEVYGFVDDNPANFGKRINGRKVLGNRHHLGALAELYKINEIILALDTDQPGKVSNAVKACQKAGLNYRMFSPTNGHGGNGPALPFRKVTLSDLLSLPQITMDVDAVRKTFHNRTLLVYGTSGALGAELCRQLLRCGAAKLIIIEKYEDYLSHLVAELYAHFPETSIIPVFVDRHDASTIEQVFREHRPYTVVYAAARRYAPIFQYDWCPNSAEAGCEKELARLSKAYEAKLFLMLSSLQACENNGNPTLQNLRNEEWALQQLLEKGDCRLVITRMCDILENPGNIISIMEEQIKANETVLLPSPDAQICIISKESAAQFILQHATNAGRNGEGECGLFECNGGQSYSVLEIAKQIANFYGLKLGRDLAVKFLDGGYKQTPDADNSETRATCQTAP